MKSIKAKISIAISIICIFILSLSIMAGYMVSYNSIKKEVISNTLLNSQKYGENINGWLEGQGKILSEIGDSIENSKNFDKDTILPYLNSKVKSNEYTTDVYLGLRDKTFWDGSGWTPEADYDCTTRNWYKQGMENNKLTYTTPFLDLATKKMVISIVRPIARNGETVGVLSTDINIDTITKIIENAKPVNDSYGILLDGDNDILVHPNNAFKPTDKELKKVDSVLDGKYKELLSSSKSGEGVTITDYDGKQKYFSMTTIPVSNWKVGFAFPTSEFKKPLDSLIVYYIFITFISLIICIIAAIIIGNRIGKPLVILAKVIDKMKQLDLTKDDNYHYILKHNDEVGRMAVSIKNLREELRNILLDLKVGENEVGDESSKLSQTVEENMESITNINSAVSEIAQGSTPKRLKQVMPWKNLIL